MGAEVDIKTPDEMRKIIPDGDREVDQGGGRREHGARAVSAIAN